MNKKILVPLADGFEEIEAISIVDILRRANIKVMTASLSDGLDVFSARNVIIKSDTNLDNVINDEFDGIVLPGGIVGVNNLRNDNRIISLIKSLYNKNKLVAGICASPIVLGEAGVINGKFTCYPSLETSVKCNGTYILDDLVCVDNNVITSKGPATSILFALSIVDYLTNNDNQKLKNDLLVPLIMK